ncbi:MAG TPA: hypothetical protein PKN57_11660 [Saprospiraceae bacterium]|jgi:hypothetical protein|nr:hypothetical protein [Saprospiraceae bacterium]HMW74254.1 hypothetical protein [Saprospiraceae bacterium]HMX82721.1 hypothetical protein [Saprospiraceae bacterium]HMX85636.1 hypothetical protein [Saprospiraceae bacterium]HMZ74214.1 hypothetical protein [Saprospiraceae bacterium]
MAKKISVIALCFCYIIMIYTAFIFYPKWKQSGTEATISWDASGYYMYLPALFIYKDIKKCAFKDSILAKYSPTPDFQQAFVHTKSSNYVMKYSSGQAITMMPFFFMAHLWCKLNPAYPADGFSYPYQFAIGVGMLFYAFIGLFFLRKILLHFFKDSTVAILLLCYAIGTNYLNYSSIDQAMTHNVLFTIYCLNIFLTIIFQKSPSYKSAFSIGILIGLATLIRPTDIISALIPLLWTINSSKDLIPKIRFIRQHFSKHLIIAVSALAVFSIQLIYWKWVANEWFVYSYQDQGFSWLHPHLYNYTLSYKCGWLRYCPMMILPLTGLYFYLKTGVNKVAIIAFTIINLYIVTAWDIWDYGNTAGRAMIQSYPILAFPFCALIERMTKNKRTATILAIPVLFFTYMNIWWTYHAHAGNTQITDVTREYYWKVAGRWNESDEDKKLLDNPHAFYGTPKNEIILYRNSFDNDTSQNAVQETNNNLIKINKELQQTSLYSIQNNSSFKKWIRASADFRCTIKEWDIWKQAQFIVQFYDKDTVIQTNLIHVHRFISDGETENIYLDAIVPVVKWDKLTISIWNANGDKELFIDNLMIQSFND